ncbi:MAG: ATP-binding protein, partial [Phycisphaerales bacterium]|nr:ATP-binding protein [Phycisphaerales bacterium]
QIGRLEAELAEANEQLHRSRELASLGEMAAGIAHEIRNPLASIQLFAEVLSEDLEDRPEQADLCSKIEISVQRMDTIVRDVLRFARKATVRCDMVNSSTLMHAVMEACASQSNDAGVHVVQHMGSDPDVHVDLSLMTQAIGNVLRNAIEAMRGSEVTGDAIDLSVHECRMRCPDGMVRDRIVFGVADRGPGIDDESLSKLFNPFFTTRDTGTGLGLAIAHRVVEAHQGHIAVARRDGGGMHFEVCLPAVESSSAQHREATE